MSRINIKSLFRLKTSYLAVNCQALSTKSRRPFPVLGDSFDTSTVEASNALAVSKSADEELNKLREVCIQGGGEKGIARHVKLNRKVLARDRVKSLLDPGCEFWELCTTAGLGLEYGDVPAGGVVAGVGKIHGVDTMIIANDGTVKGGTFYPITITKQLRLQEIAKRNRIPCLAVVDTGGAFLPLQADIFLQGGRGFGNQAIMSSQGIQQVALVSGLCTAGGAYAPTMSDIAVITHRIGNIYLGGPPLVKAATGEVVTGEELGGATMHCSVSGITDHFAQDEEESFAITRDVMATLNLDPTPELVDDPPLYSSEGLEVLAGMGTIDKPGMMALLARITDASRFFEFKAMFGGNLVCGFGHLYGQLTGFIANAGPITAQDAQKGGHFVQLCDNRDIPLVFLQNSSLSHGAACDGTTMKERAKFMQCQSVVRVPKITLNVGGVAADENYTMCGPSFEPNFYFMWPRATMTKSDPGLIEPLPETEGTKKPRKKLSQYEFCTDSSAWAAARTVCDGIVEPAGSRGVLARAVQIGMFHHVKSRDSRGAERNVVRM
eukprot:GFUD01039025.1.p1 GENE.GFUD01039025.1~~GFUD01039025.1.p1  ORF type:complete len:550 (-),score=189.29 GFUD01039025.1:85-1734(-)